MSEKADKAKADIIKAARKVLSNIGVRNMTLQAVADAASISKGALYHYYKSKNDILYDIMEQDNAHSRLLAKKAIDPDYEYNPDELKMDVVKGVLDRCYRFDKNKLNLYLQGEALQGNSELKRKYDDKYHEWVNNINTILARIYGIDSDPLMKTFSSLFLAVIDGICLQYALMNKVDADEEYIGKIMMFLLNMNYKQVAGLIRENPELKF